MNKRNTVMRPNKKVEKRMGDEITGQKVSHGHVSTGAQSKKVGKGTRSKIPN